MIIIITFWALKLTAWIWSLGGDGTRNIASNQTILRQFLAMSTAFLWQLCLLPILEPFVLFFGTVLDSNDSV